MDQGVSQEFMQRLKKTCVDQFKGAKFKILPRVSITNINNIERRLNEYTHKTQFFTINALNYLEQRLQNDTFCLIGVTSKDLYPNLFWNFTYSHRLNNKRVSIVSLSRYHD